MGAVVEVRGVTFGYGERTVLEDVTLAVEEGDFWALMGPNGSGKTTLVKLVLGLLKPRAGEIRLFGCPVGSFRCWHRIGYVPQRATLEHRFPTTVEEVVMAGRTSRLGPGRRPGREDRRAVEEALELLGLLELRRLPLSCLSGGQQQKVFLARALAGRPELLILDEPEAGLDSLALGSFYALLQRLNREMNMTLLVVTHDTGAVARHVGKVACLNRRIICHGPPAQVLTRANLARLYGFPVRRLAHGH
ncbi:metal ABC transporter ATP-binding protein [Desulfovirgula thermocuniculi]|uniref:metal ABC transporter ATP-binding protein n=1 Tax=Desulfovirgula thermocuniculi TaxID=348842 RepID=UPI0004284465|nr:metal ABC transporter ATP-binding protein [Desulfovirgula thermocuniculi]